MAKATATGGGAKKGGRPPVTPQPRADRASYILEVYQELRKTTWPTPRELRRMTEVVIATVVLFGLLIGGLDLLLSVIVKPIYTQIGTTQASPSVQQTFTPVPRTTPTASASAASAATGTSTRSATASPAAPTASSSTSATGTATGSAATGTSPASTRAASPSTSGSPSP